MEKLPISLQKKQIRERISNLLKHQSPEDRQKKSSVIATKLLGMPEFVRAKTILFYASFDGEVETFEMIKRAQQLKKTIGLPRINPSNAITPILINDLDHDLEKGKYGIKEPKIGVNRQLSVDELDMVIVPGIGYDRSGQRLGRGVGYYDRFLKLLPKSVTTVGIAFDFQLVEKLPVDESHDIPVSFVLSN